VGIADKKWGKTRHVDRVVEKVGGSTDPWPNTASVWFFNLVVRASDLRLSGREFDRRPPHHCSIGTGMVDHLLAAHYLGM